jgi:hypothetical protein
MFAQGGRKERNIKTHVSPSSLFPQNSKSKSPFFYSSSPPFRYLITRI